MKPILPLITLCALALAGCQQQAEKAAPSVEASSAASGPDAKPGLALKSGRLMLPAVKGHPGAAYFVIGNSSSKTAVLAGVFIDGAGKADMHQSASDKDSGIETMVSVARVELAPGTSIAFEPGKFHVMAYDLEDKLQPGGTTEMTLTFADGDKISAPLTIEAAGGGEHGDAH